MIIRDREMLLASNSIKMKGGLVLEFSSWRITKNQKESTVTTVKLRDYTTHIRFNLDQYKKASDETTKFGCEKMHKEILNKIGQDLTDGTLKIKGVNE